MSWPSITPILGRVPGAPMPDISDPHELAAWAVSAPFLIIGVRIGDDQSGRDIGAGLLDEVPR